MVDSLYADKNHVVEALEQMQDRTYEDPEVNLAVYDTEAVLRGVTYDEVRERNVDRILDDHLCTITYDGTRLKLSFHQKILEEPFTLQPANRGAIAAEQAPSPAELAPSLAPVLDDIEDEYDIITYDFIELGAGSMANGGHFTDFEFDYVITTTEF